MAFNTDEIGLIGEKYAENILFPQWEVNFLNVTKSTDELNCSFFQNVDIDFIISKKYSQEELREIVADTVNNSNKLFFNDDFDFIEVKTQTERLYVKQKEFRYDICHSGLPGGVAKTRATKIIWVYISPSTKEILSVIQINMLSLRRWITKEKNLNHLILKPFEKGECLNIYIPMKVLFENKIAKEIYFN